MNKGFKFLVMALLLVVSSIASAGTYPVAGTVTIVEGYESAGYFRVGYHDGVAMVWLTGCPELPPGWEPLEDGEGSFSGVLYGNIQGMNFFAQIQYPYADITQPVIMNQSGTTYFHFRFHEYTSGI